MKKCYDNSLKIMFQGEEMLTMIIKTFIKEFPDAINSKIENYSKKGIAKKDDKRWSFIDTGKAFSISLGDTSTSCKDFMNLYVSSLSDEKIAGWPRFETEKLIGYITLYLYDDKNRKEKPLQLNYDYHLRKVDKKFYMSITTNVNGYLKDNAEKIERYGLKEVHENVVNSGPYQIDVTEILNNIR